MLPPLLPLTWILNAERETEKFFMSWQSKEIGPREATANQHTQQSGKPEGLRDQNQPVSCSIRPVQRLHGEQQAQQCHSVLACTCAPQGLPGHIP